MRLTWRPIEKWDGTETAERRPPLFKASLADTKSLLGYELGRLDADVAVLQVDVTEHDCRLDGLLRSGASPRTPRVRLSFESVHGALTYQSDVFTTWQANLRGIALGLQALRQLERYGIAGRGEQYTGWAQLGSGIAMSAGMTPDEAVRVMLDLLMEDGAAAYEPLDLYNAGPGPFLEDAYRGGAKRWHPDNEGGDGEKFYLLTKARDVLAASR